MKAEMIQTAWSCLKAEHETAHTCLDYGAYCFTGNICGNVLQQSQCHISTCAETGAGMQVHI